MKINFWLDGAKGSGNDRHHASGTTGLSCYSVKEGCETANCSLCTVLVNDKPMLSCSVLAARIDGKRSPWRTSRRI